MKRVFPFVFTKYCCSSLHLVPDLENSLYDENVNAKDDSDKTTVMFAVERGKTDVDISLIDKGAEVNVEKK